MDYGLTVFTVANERYEPFALPYAASVLHHNPNATVEIVLEQPDRFAEQNADALALLADTFPDVLHFTSADFSAFRNPHVMRYLLQPRRRNQYVYIGDIDIMVLEEIAPAHLAHMERTGLPFSNIIRPNDDRMGGLHFSEWAAFYPQPEITGGDLLSRAEHCLYALIKKKGRGLPDRADTFRPIHGYHMTLSRPPHAVIGGWGATLDPDLLQAYLRLRGMPIWHSLVPLLDRRYRQLLTILDAGLSAYFRKKIEPMPGTFPRDWWLAD